MFLSGILMFFRLLGIAIIVLGIAIIVVEQNLCSFSPSAPKLKGVFFLILRPFFLLFFLDEN